MIIISCELSYHPGDMAPSVRTNSVSVTNEVLGGNGGYKARFAFMSKWDGAEVVFYMTRKIKCSFTSVGKLAHCNEKFHLYASLTL